MFVAVVLGVAVGVLVINKLGAKLMRAAVRNRLNQQKGVEMRYLNQITGMIWEDMTSANVAGMIPIAMTDYFPLTGSKLDRIRKKNPDAFIAICARLAPLAMALKQAVEMRGGMPTAIQNQVSQVQQAVMGEFDDKGPKPPLPPVRA